jgi:hypothetical protein
MCRALEHRAFVWTLALGACGGGGLEQAADGNDGESSSGDDGVGPTTLPPMMTTASATTMDGTMGGGDATDTSAPTTGDPTTATTTDPGEDTGSDGSGPGESSDGASATTGLGDCADQDEGSTYPLVVTGSTTGRADDITPGCGTGDGPEIVIRWTAPAAGTYVVDTIGSSFDTILSVRSDCDGSEIACDDDIEAGDLDSALTVELLEDESVVIVVDGSNGSGDFVLHVTWQGYGNCLDFPLEVVCGPGEACFSNASIGVCGVFQCEDVGDCPPPPPDGTAVVVCRDIGGTPRIDDCGLDCSGGATCPTGMSCQGNDICYW